MQQRPLLVSYSSPNQLSLFGALLPITISCDIERCMLAELLLNKKKQVLVQKSTVTLRDRDQGIGQDAEAEEASEAVVRWSIGTSSK